LHPAPSLILFSTLSGTGFGLLALLGLGLRAPEGLGAFLWFALAFGLAGGGLAASTFHLKRPSRAHLAFTQVRTSWLSREAVLAVAALLLMGVFALLRIGGLGAAPLGWLGAVLCAATVLCTAMIYAQMRTVPRWRHWTTPALFLAFSLAGGAACLGLRLLAGPLLAGAAVLQVLNWRHGAGAFRRAGSTAATATGLKGFVRAWAPPHTGPNYLTREMTFVVARRRAEQLRLVTLLFGFALPFAALATPLWPLAAPLHLLGALASRWLFLAEAEHVVGLYYGAR
jgi:DMSO reductase anchor subunit